MSGAPYLYDYVNFYNAKHTPSTIHASNTALSIFFQRYLLQEALSVYKWSMPKTWSKDYFLYTLYCRGYLAIIKTDRFGVVPQQCGLSGYDIFYRPNTATISNALLRGFKQLRIGVDCTVIKLMPDYGGIMDLVVKYADLMACTMQTAGCNIVASKLAYVFTAGNKAGAESFKKMFDKIAVGEPMVVQDEKLRRADGSNAWEMFSNNLSQNYIAGELLADLQKWRAQFCTEIGIPNANTEKRERMIVDEVNANNIETYSKAELWLEELRDGCQKAREMFPGLELDVTWRYEPVKEVGADGIGNDERDGAL